MVKGSHHYPTLVLIKEKTSYGPKQSRATLKGKVVLGLCPKGEGAGIFLAVQASLTRSCIDLMQTGRIPPPPSLHRSFDEPSYIFLIEYDYSY